METNRVQKRPQGSTQLEKLDPLRANRLQKAVRKKSEVHAVSDLDKETQREKTAATERRSFEIQDPPLAISQWTLKSREGSRNQL